MRSKHTSIDLLFLRSLSVYIYFNICILREINISLHGQTFLLILQRYLSTLLSQYTHLFLQFMAKFLKIYFQGYVGIYYTMSKLPTHCEKTNSLF